MLTALINFIVLRRTLPCLPTGFTVVVVFLNKINGSFDDTPRYSMSIVVGDGKEVRGRARGDVDSVLRFHTSGELTPQSLNSSFDNWV